MNRNVSISSLLSSGDGENPNRFPNLYGPFGSQQPQPQPPHTNHPVATAALAAVAGNKPEYSTPSPSDNGLRKIVSQYQPIMVDGGPNNPIVIEDNPRSGNDQDLTIPQDVPKHVVRSLSPQIRSPFASTPGTKNHSGVQKTAGLSPRPSVGLKHNPELIGTKLHDFQTSFNFNFNSPTSKALNDSPKKSIPKASDNKRKTPDNGSKKGKPENKKSKKTPEPPKSTTEENKIELAPPVMLDVKPGNKEIVVNKAEKDRDKKTNNHKQESEKRDHQKENKEIEQKEPEKKEKKELPILALNVPLIDPKNPKLGQSEVVVNVMKLAEDKYGWDALHPDAKSAIDVMDEMIEDDDDNDNMEEDEVVIEEDETKKKKEDHLSEEQLVRRHEARMNRKVGKYDYEDPFIDDDELQWEEGISSTKEGFFVYWGPLIDERQGNNNKKAIKPKK